MLASLLLAYFCVIDAALIHVPIKRYVTMPDFTMHSMPLLEASAVGGSANKVQDVELDNYKNLQYYGDIEVGTSKTRFTVVFDTGSASLWLPTENPAGSSHSVYNGTISETHEADGGVFSIEYGSGKVAGTLVRDDILIGDLKLVNFTFAEINDTSGLGDLWTNSAWDGILGLGWDSLSHNGLPTVMRALVASGQLAEPVFGFYLGDDEAGQLVFGGVDPMHYSGTFNFVPLTVPRYWQIALDGITVRNRTNTSVKSAVVDSGTSMIVGPMEAVHELMRSVGATAHQVGGGTFYGVPCSVGIPTVNFEMGGVTYSLTFEELVLAQEQDICYLAFKGMNMVHLAGEPFWLLGDFFMRKYYVEFDWDRKRVGIATAA